jgi:hypothetical protein
MKVWFSRLNASHNISQQMPFAKRSPPYRSAPDYGHGLDFLRGADTKSFTVHQKQEPRLLRGPFPCDSLLRID